MEPAAISARPAVTMMWVWLMAPVSPAARAKGTVRPSDIPITTSRTTSLAVKWRSIWGVCGIRISESQQNHLAALQLEADIYQRGLIVKTHRHVAKFDFRLGSWV